MSSAHRLLAKEIKAKEETIDPNSKDEGFDDEFDYDVPIDEPEAQEEEEMEELRPYRPIPGKVTKVVVEEDEPSLFAYSPIDSKYYEKPTQEGRCNPFYS